MADSPTTPRRTDREAELEPKTPNPSAGLLGRTDLFMLSPLSSPTFSSPTPLPHLEGRQRFHTMSLPMEPSAETVMSNLSSDPGVDMSSPIRSKADAIRKAVRRREANRLAERQSKDEEENQRKKDALIGTLDYLEAHNLTFGDLVCFVSDPDNWQGNARYRGFFSVPGRVEQVLTWWVSGRNSRVGREVTHSWAVEYVERVVNSEGNSATKSKFLQSQNMAIYRDFVLNFSLSKIYSKLTELCPTLLSILRAFSTTPRQEKEMTASSAQRKDNVCYCIDTYALLFTCSGV